MSLRSTIGSAGRRAKAAIGRALGRFRRAKQEQVVLGHGGEVIRPGMRVRASHYAKDTPKLVTRVLTRSNEIELEYEDGVRATMLAGLYVPVRARRRRR